MRILRNSAGAFALLAFASGCTGGDSFKPSANISGIEPNQVASGRSITVEIHGNFTKWKESSLDVADVSFGAGITVTSLTVANAGYLVVGITAANDAAVGFRDVEVDGKLAVGAFEVVRPFEVVNANVVQGDYHLLTIVGHETKWVDGITQVLVQEGDVYTFGDDLFGSTFTEVIAPNLLRALVQVDPFAPPGGRTLVINDVQSSDTGTNAITVEAGTFTLLAAGNTPMAVGNGGSATGKARIPAGAALSVQVVTPLRNTDGAQPIGVVLDPDLGMASPLGFIGDEDFFGVQPAKELANFEAGKELVVLFWDAAWLDDFFFGGLDFEGSDLPFDVLYSNDAAETIGGGLTGEELAAAGDERWFHMAAANRWDILDFSVVANGALSPILRVYNELGTSSASSLFGENPDVINAVAGEDLDVLVGVRDAAGSAFGTANNFDISFTATAPPGMMFENQTDAAIPESGVVTSTINATSGFTNFTQVRVGLDITHTYRSDLWIDLTSPDGTLVELVCYPGADEDGFVALFPVTALECGFLSDFTFDTTWDGTWTLTVYDDYPPDGGTLRSWALFLEGS